MSNKELIHREDVKAKKVYCDERHEYVVPVAEIGQLSPVTQHEMTAMELLYAVRQMSSADSNAYGEYFTLFIIKEDIKSAMRYVEEWALKHLNAVDNEEIKERSKGYVVPVAETDRLSPVTQHEMTAIDLLYAVGRMRTRDSKAYLEYCTFFIIKEDLKSAMRYVKEWALKHPEKTNDE